MRWTLVIIFLLLMIFSFFGTISSTDPAEDKKNYKQLAAVFGALAVLAAVTVR